MKIRHLIVFVALIISTLFMAGTVHAKEMRNANNINVNLGETVDSSLTASGNKIKIDGTVNGNLYCMGQDVEISGQISGSVYCAGSKVNVSGRVDGDLFVMAQDAKLSGTIDGSVNILAASFSSDSKTRIRQDLSVASASLSLDGLVARDVNISSNSAKIGAIIGRNLEGNFGSLELTENADIRGNVKYSSNSNIKQDSGAKVKGNITKVQMSQSGMMASGFAGMLISFLIILASLLLVSLVTVLIMPNFYIKTKDKINDSLGASIGWGLFNLVIVPIAAFFLILTGIGVPLAGLVYASWVLSLMLSGPIFAYFIGSKVIKNKKLHFITMLVGSIIVLALYLIPVVNVLVGLAVVVIGTGSIIRLIKGSKLHTKKA